MLKSRFSRTIFLYFENNLEYNFFIFWEKVVLLEVSLLDFLNATKNKKTSPIFVKFLDLFYEIYISSSREKGPSSNFLSLTYSGFVVVCVRPVSMEFNDVWVFELR